MADIEVKTDGTGITITLKGDFDIENASELYQIVLDATQKYDVVYIDLGEVGRVDLSFFQIVCALYKEAVREGKKLVFDPIPTKIMTKAEKMGFTEEYTGGYFWKGEVNA